MTDALGSQGLFGVGGAGSTDYYYPVDLESYVDPGMPAMAPRNRTMGVQSPTHFAKEGIYKPMASLSGDLTTPMALLHLAYISQHKVSAAQGGNTKAATWTLKGGFRSSTASTLYTYPHDRLIFWDDAIRGGGTDFDGLQLNTCVPTSFTISGSDGRVKFSSTWMGESVETCEAPSSPTVQEDEEFEFEQDVDISYNSTNYDCDSFELNFVLPVEHRAITKDLTAFSHDASGANSLTYVAGTATAYGTITSAAGTPFANIPQLRPGNWVNIAGNSVVTDNNGVLVRIVERTSTVLTVEAAKLTAGGPETSAAVTFTPDREPYGVLKQTGIYAVNGSFTRSYDSIALRNKVLANSTTTTLAERSLPTMDAVGGAALVITIGDRTLVTGAAAGLNHKVAITLSSAILQTHSISKDGDRVLETVNFTNEYNATDNGSWQAVVVAACTGNANDIPIEDKMNSQYASA